MFEKTKEDVEKAFRHAEDLINSRSYDPESFDLKEVSKNMGVYLWRSKESGRIVYIGRAIGKKGLYQRIVRNHLSNSSTKSVLKKQIAEKEVLDIKAEAAEFVKKNFTFSYLEFERADSNIVVLVEVILINEYRPKYNRDGVFDKDNV